MASYMRYDESTPSGADYSEIYYFDDANHIVDESLASKCVIRECKNDGTLVMETWGVVEHS